AQFSTARIGAFVPVLAQRCAKAKLEVLKSAGATARAGGNGFASVSELEIAEDDPARPLSPSQGPEGGDCSCSGRGPRSGYRCSRARSSRGGEALHREPPGLEAGRTA